MVTLYCHLLESSDNQSTNCGDRRIPKLKREGEFFEVSPLRLGGDAGHRRQEALSRAESRVPAAPLRLRAAEGLLDPKSPASRRSIPLPPHLAPLGVRQNRGPAAKQGRREEERTAAGRGGKEGPCPSARGHPPWEHTDAHGAGPEPTGDEETEYRATRTPNVVRLARPDSPQQHEPGAQPAVLGQGKPEAETAGSNARFLAPRDTRFCICLGTWLRVRRWAFALKSARPEALKADSTRRRLGLPPPPPDSATPQPSNSRHPPGEAFQDEWEKWFVFQVTQTVPRGQHPEPGLTQAAPAWPAGKPRPLLAHPGKRSPAPCPRPRPSCRGHAPCPSPAPAGSAHRGWSRQRRRTELPGEGVLRGRGSAENGACSRPGGPGGGSGESRRGRPQEGAEDSGRTPEGRGLRTVAPAGALRTLRWQGPGPPGSERRPPQEPGVGLEPEPGAPLPGPGREPLRRGPGRPRFPARESLRGPRGLGERASLGALRRGRAARGSPCRAEPTGEDPGSAPPPRAPPAPARARAAACAPGRAAEGAGAQASSLVCRPLPPGSDPRLPRTRPGSGRPCPPTRAELDPAPRGPRPLRPSHCPAPADKARDPPAERSPPPDPLHSSVTRTGSPEKCSEGLAGDGPEGPRAESTKQACLRPRRGPAPRGCGTYIPSPDNGCLGNPENEEGRWFAQRLLQPPLPNELYRSLRILGTSRSPCSPCFLHCEVRGLGFAVQILCCEYRKTPLTTAHTIREGCPLCTTPPVDEGPESGGAGFAGRPFEELDGPADSRVQSGGFRSQERPGRAPSAPDPPTSPLAARPPPTVAPGGTPASCSRCLSSIGLGLISLQVPRPPPPPEAQGMALARRPAVLKDAQGRCSPPPCIPSAPGGLAPATSYHAHPGPPIGAGAGELQGRDGFILKRGP
ncbi:basic proline-rich protein-like [Canis lupus dingo]|uniref:basic proline-rich protein-like n=1 Tax=Canis lupus dingo TaxID=286419 RepID=UPI0020C20E87|nr:basic proline-rich protein-like [Canis lupus dingo]